MKRIIMAILILSLVSGTLACPMDGKDAGHYVRFKFIDSNYTPLINYSISFTNIVEPDNDLEWFYSAFGLYYVHKPTEIITQHGRTDDNGYIETVLMGTEKYQVSIVNPEQEIVKWLELYPYDSDFTIVV